MKKIFAAVAAALVALAALPIIAGCGGNVEYKLGTDDNGDKFYTVRCTGFPSSLTGEFEIPEYYGEGEAYAPVTKIADEGFSGTGFRKITVPKTVTHIGKAAFAYNDVLTSVEFAEGGALEEISRGVFGNCISLKRVELPDSVKTVGALAFYGCGSLESVSLPSVELIGDNAFEECFALKTVDLPQTLVTIGSRCFLNSGLTEITVPDSVHTVGEGEDEIPAIGYAAFCGCKSLTVATVGEGITVLPTGLFSECAALTEIYLPASLKEIEGAYLVNGAYVCGHPFLNVPLEDVYFSGTREEWDELLKHTDNTPAYQNNVTSDNGALFKARIHVN